MPDWTKLKRKPVTGGEGKTTKRQKRIAPDAELVRRPFFS